VGPSHFFVVVVVDFIIYLVCRFSLWNANLICNTCLSFLFFFSKRKNNKNSFFNPNFVDLFTGVRVRNTIFFRLCNIYQRSSWKYS
jgi:hypothetical protein